MCPCLESPMPLTKLKFKQQGISFECIRGDAHESNLMPVTFGILQGTSVAAHGESHVQRRCRCQHGAALHTRAAEAAAAGNCSSSCPTLLGIRCTAEPGVVHCHRSKVV